MGKRADRSDRVTDTPAMIAMCLDCPWPDCVDCLDSSNAYGYAIRLWFKHNMEYRQEDLEKIRRLKCTKN